MGETDRRHVEGDESRGGALDEHVELLPVDLIDPNPYQSRRSFTHLTELTASIKAMGVLVPIKIRRQGERYRIIYGERRWRAACAAGLRRIPCLIAESNFENVDEMSLVENEQRDDLNVIDHVMAVREFSLRGYPGKDIAMLIGKSAAHVSKCLSAGEFFSRAMAAGFLSYPELTETDLGLEYAYIASTYADHTGDLGFGADLLRYAASSSLTREQMQSEAERRIATAQREGAGEEEESSAPWLLAPAVRGTGDCIADRPESTKEMQIHPTGGTVRRFQITLAGRMTSGRMVRMLDTMSDMLEALSTLADAELKVGQADKAAVSKALDRAARSLSVASASLGQVRARMQ